MFQIYAGNTLVYEPGDMNLVLLTPKLTLEMGKAGSLEFTVPAGHPYMSDLKQLTKPVSVDLDGEKIFRGRILSGTRTFYNQREVYCEGVLSYLVDSVQKAEKFDGKTHALFRKIIANHNARMPAEKQFTVGNITVENRDIILTGQSEDISQYDYKQIAINSIVDNWNTTYDYIETCLISYCGGYLVTRKVGTTNYIDWVTDYTSTSTQEIVFGENLLDLRDESSAEDIFTVLIPIGDDNLTIKSVNNNSDEIVDSAKVAKYGRIVKTNVFSNVTNPQTLLENGQRYLANNGDVPTTLTITAVDLHSVYPEIRAIHLGDRVYIRSDPHELSQYLTCTKIEYDLEKPENTVYTFGREKQTLTQQYREDKRAQSDTYSNSASGGYGVGSGYGGYGAVNQGVQEATEKTAAEFENFYDEWIDYDPDHPDGKISLGALAEMYIGKDGNAGDRYKLINNVGIDLDAPSGQISLATTSQIANNANTKTAQIIAWAGVDEDGQLGSRIALEADLVTVSNRLQAIEGIFDRVSGNTAYFKRDISTSSIYGNHYFINTVQGDSLDLVSHYHNITADNNGGLLIGPPIASEDRVPFRIADTKAYQDAVSAVVLTGLAGTSYTAEDSILSGTVPSKANTVYSGNMVFGCLTTTLSNGKTKTIRVGINAEKAYDAGRTKGQSDVTLTGLAGTTYTAEDSVLSGTVSSQSNTVYSGNMVFGCLTTTLSNGKTKTIRVGIHAGKAYTAGQNSITQRSISNVYYESGEDGGADYGHIWVRFSDGTTQANIPITNAYSIGYRDGQASVTPHYATFEVRAISPSGAYVYIYSSETGLMRLYEGDTFDQT